jgi:SAM-dependent methyltransferase
MMIGNYKDHAAVWDWDGFDESEELKFWSDWAVKYGKNVLIPMCALGEKGVYMAEQGFNVIAFDITEEMVNEGNKRFGKIKNLQILHGDVRKFKFNIDLVDFVFIKWDINHLLNINDVKKSFESINKHMRKGGCFSLEVELPSDESYSWPQKTYYPRKIKHKDKTIWKISEGNYDAETKRKYISQTVFIEDKKMLRSFEHKFYLQLYERKEIINSLIECNFSIRNEYCDHNYKKYDGGEYLIIEAIKR